MTHMDNTKKCPLLDKPCRKEECGFYCIHSPNSSCDGDCSFVVKANSLSSLSGQLYLLVDLITSITHLLVKKN